MRWMWIDRVVELVKGERLVAVKNVSMAEEHLHDHAEVIGRAAGVKELAPVVPATLIIEGMAQSAGILVGHAADFREKVILAKISKAVLTHDVTPGCTIRFTAIVQQMTAQGASVAGTVETLDPCGRVPPAAIGSIDLVFSHVDANMAGTEYPAHNFVFGESFRTLLRLSGVAIP